MASTFSSNASTQGHPSPRSIKDEVEKMHEFIVKTKKNNRKTRKTAIIAVVRYEAKGSLENKYKRHWWKFQFEKLAPFVTTQDQLQHTIDDIKYQIRNCNLIIIASSHISTISFDVSGHIKTLTLLQCDSGTVLISGKSTFNKVRLDAWQDKKHAHKLFLGEGVYIEVDFCHDSWANAMKGKNYFSSAEKERLKAEFRKAEESEEEEAGEYRWSKLKGAIAVLLGIAAGAYAINLKVSAAGIFVNFKLGNIALTMAAGGFKASVTAACPVILLVASVVACVYFVPWEKVWSWAKNFFPSIRDWIYNLWQNFKSWFYGKRWDDSEESSHKTGTSPFFFS